MSVKPNLRRQIAHLLSQAGLDNTPALQMEAIYKTVKREKDRYHMKEPLQIEAVQELALAEEVKAATNYAIALPKRNSTIWQASQWAEIPLANSSGTYWDGKPELEGITEEVYQAARQLEITGIELDSLGPAGRIFDLKRMGTLLELVYEIPEQSRSSS